MPSLPDSKNSDRGRRETQIRGLLQYDDKSKKWYVVANPESGETLAGQRLLVGNHFSEVHPPPALSGSTIRIRVSLTDTPRRFNLLLSAQALLSKA